MRFEIVPECRDERPYPTALFEFDYLPASMSIPNGTDSEILAAAKAKEPDGRAFVINRETTFVHFVDGIARILVNYERPYKRWFVEVSTLEELLALLESFGAITVQGNMIREW